VAVAVARPARSAGGLVHHLRRFGPQPWSRPTGDLVYAIPAATIAPQRLTGDIGEIGWELYGTGGRVLHTFPRWAWRRELLPAAHLVADAAARYSGTVRIGERRLDITAAPGATARIFGHGNARRWGWLHADLGDGDLLEVVAAVATRPGLRRLPPLPMVRLRLGGVDWPAVDPLLGAARFRARLGRPEWTVGGAVADRRLLVRVRMPADRTVSVDYTDPDGSPAVCHNTERATAIVRLWRRTGGSWRTERDWTVPAHAEIGER
jgi:hypothetical protein